MDEQHETDGIVPVMSFSTKIWDKNKQLLEIMHPYLYGILWAYKKSTNLVREVGAFW